MTFTIEMSEKLNEDGYKDITNIDFSEVVIEQMKAKYANKPGLTCTQQIYSLDIDMTMDATKLQFPDDSFDIVIDKGTIDSQLCAEGSARVIHLILKEVFRVLKFSGKFVLASFSKTRATYLQRPDLKWKISTEQLGIKFHCSLFLL